LRLGGRSEHQIDFDSCSGCGACAHVCPANAVTFKQLQPEMSEAIT
jgi:ferredoxin-type protein NapF